MTDHPTAADPAAADPAGDDVTWAMVAHGGGAITLFLAPLAVLLSRGGRSPFVRGHAVQALNFQLVMMLAYLASWLLTYLLIGLFLLPLVFVGDIVLSVSAAMAVRHGRQVRYPLQLRLVK